MCMVGESQSRSTGSCTYHVLRQRYPTQHFVVEELEKEQYIAYVRVDNQTCDSWLISVDHTSRSWPIDHLVLGNSPTVQPLLIPEYVAPSP